MRTITMTQAQTETYDANGEAGALLMAQLRSEAREMAQDGETVEIHTADGIVAGVVQDVEQDA